MDPSPPPTPSSSAPRNRRGWRFKTITTACEWVEDYRPGGYHPVDLGDVFNEGQYKVIRKLGEGSFSTVWLARDEKHSRYVALKILAANIVSPTSEMRILRFLSTIPEADKYVTRLLDEFDHQGPNGTHTCLVFEAMGTSVSRMASELPQFKRCSASTKVRYPPAMAKSILKQALLGLNFLHNNGISHGDFHPGNMLFGLEDGIHMKDETVLGQQKFQDEVSDEDSEDEEDPNIEYGFAKVERRDGKPDIWAPQYLYEAQPLAQFTPYSEGFKIKLADMGGAYFRSDPPEKIVTPAYLRSPELILTGTIDKSLDVWSFGCLVFELLTGTVLFCVPYSEPWERDDSHLRQLTFGIGPLPDDLYQHWGNSSLYFTPERKLYNMYLGGPLKNITNKSLEDQMKFCLSMEEMFDEEAPEISAEEAHMIKTLIRRILQYDPAQRPSAEDILQDPWFAE